MDLNKPMYTRQEVAEILSVGIIKVDQLCLEGTLTRININENHKRGTYRITGESLRNFINPPKDNE